jgi:NAD(P)H-nitrite reductase large subunit
MPIGIDHPLSLLLQDVGASEMVADGRIKIKSDSELERFTERGVLFKDGSELEADVIVFATG